jgi:hypothetical protein
MSKKLAVAVLGMSVVVAGVAWKKTLESSLPGHTLSVAMTAQGGDPVPRPPVPTGPKAN